MSTQIKTGLVRLSYASVWEPRVIANQPNSKPKYSCSLIIPKSDKATINAINKAVEEALQNGIGKFGGKIPNRATLKLPLRDGDVDREGDPAYENCYFINTTANEDHPPQIVNNLRQPIFDHSEVYSGCYAKVIINFYAFNVQGNRGVACGLQAIQKIRDGEPLGSHLDVNSVFDVENEDEDLGL